ncbi:hypothetical protein Hanom_Chr16g01514281 [Helianthus anomalus]
MIRNYRPMSTHVLIWFRVMYTASTCGLPKFWIWSLTFQKHTNGSYGLHFVTHLVPDQQI